MAGRVWSPCDAIDGCPVVAKSGHWLAGYSDIKYDHLHVGNVTNTIMCVRVCVWTHCVYLCMHVLCMHTCLQCLRVANV